MKTSKRAGRQAETRSYDFNPKAEIAKWCDTYPGYKEVIDGIRETLRDLDNTRSSGSFGVPCRVYYTEEKTNRSNAA